MAVRAAQLIEEHMKKTLIALTVATLLAGCVVDPHTARSGARGALIGAAGGAAISALTGGNLAQGAALGAAAGATVGVATSGRDRHY